MKWTTGFSILHLNDNVSFLFNFIFWPVYTACGGNYTGWSGRISYPEPPSKYPPNIDCTWYVTAPENVVKLLIEFDRFDINDQKSYQYHLGRRHCDDYLKVSARNIMNNNI